MHRKQLSFLLVAAAISLTAGLAALQAAKRFGQMNPDGVSYLDIGEAVLRGNFQELAIPYWSPLYSVLAAAAERLGGLLGLPVFGALTLLNAVQFAVAACLFVRLVRVLTGGVSADPFARSLLVFVSLGLFCAGFFLSNSLSLVTPDLLVCIVLLLISLQVLKIAGGATSPREFVIAGALLGASYWVKAVLFPLSLVWLAGLLWLLRRRRAPNAFHCAICLFGAWLVLAAPLAAAVSLRAGRLTFSEAGRLNYLWHVNAGSVPNSPVVHVPARFGTPLHSPRLIHQQPAAYALSGPFQEATYALWYDPTYWYRGMSPQFDAAATWGILKQSLRDQRRLWLSRYMLPVTALVIVGLLLARRRRHPGAGVLFAAALALVGMHMPVHIEHRYVTPALLVMLAVGLAGYYRHWNDPGTGRRGAALLLLVGCYAFAVSYRPAGSDWSKTGYNDATAALSHAGLQPGDRLCVISDGYSGVGKTPKAARLRIVAESSVRGYEEYLARHRREPLTLLEAFRAEGCKAVLAHPRHPLSQPGPGWRKIPGTGQHLLMLTPEGVR